MILVCLIFDERMALQKIDLCQIGISESIDMRSPFFCNRKILTKQYEMIIMFIWRNKCWGDTMSEIEGIRTMPCFDQEQLTPGMPIHVMEMPSLTNHLEVKEYTCLVQRVYPHELVTIYLEDKQVKEKRISVEDVVDKRCSIEILRPHKTGKRKEILEQGYQQQKATKKFSLEKLTFG